uniref:Uncharacterized protein n=1 Tax=Trichogramma kaykai TaxID=54128 RepID=A0ABD2WSX4_9HYME
MRRRSLRKIEEDNCLRMVAGGLACCETLMSEGFEMTRCDVRTIVEFFVRYKPTWNFFGVGGDEIARAAKELEVKPGVSLDDLIGPLLYSVVKV